MNDPQNIRQPASRQEIHGPSAGDPDPVRLFETARANLIANLRSEGLPSARAEQLVDAWEAEAVRRGIEVGSTAYWEQAPAWIREQAGGHVERAGSSAGAFAGAFGPFVTWLVIGSIVFGFIVFEFIHQMLTVAVGLPDWMALLLASGVVIGLVLEVVRRSGAGGALVTLPRRVAAGWRHPPAWVLAMGAILFAPMAVLVIVAIAPADAFALTSAILVATPVAFGLVTLWAAPRAAARARDRGRDPRLLIWMARLVGLIFLLQGGYMAYQAVFGFSN